MQRIALILLFLVVSGIAAIFAAGHLGINLPWNIAVTEHEPSSKDREGATSEDAKTGPQAAIDETAKALGGSSDQAAPGAGSVDIDISRISPDGTSVFAGRAQPDSYVTVLENGKPAGTAKTDENGEWTLSTEHKFASNDPVLSYEVSRTPPPEPEKPKPPERVAKAEPTQKSAAAVAGEVMRKFENLVEQAREEAKQTEQAKKAEAASDVAKEAPSSSLPVASVEPKPESSSAAAAPTPGPQQESSASAPAKPEPAEEKSTAEATVTVVPEPPKPSASAGVKTDIIPVPIMFVYNEATLTPAGERAAALLLEYLTLKHLNAVELTGHADERGTNDYNYELSRERLETVANLLKQGGYAGDLKLTPKGKSEPYMGVDRSAYSGEALFQLDRRVELRVTR